LTFLRKSGETGDKTHPFLHIFEKNRKFVPYFAVGMPFNEVEASKT